MSLRDEGTDERVLVAATALAERLIAAAAPTTRRERTTRRLFRRLFADETAVAITIALTDQVMRAPSARSGARALRAVARQAHPHALGTLNALGLRALGVLSAVAPRVSLALARQRVRAMTADLILDAGRDGLRRRVETHVAQGLKMNVNVLGEAVLGESEALARLDQVISMLEREEISYVSVKLSSIVSQLVTIDHAGSLERVRERSRQLLRAARDNGVFVNFDMEEYRDLRLTLDAFMSLLDEREFHDLAAGVVLQAYLPEALESLRSLIDFARRRAASGGAPLKVRLVKGANLAMEGVEAELHGWRPAPYDTKAEVDANYCRLFDVALDPAHAQALRVGVASHNLFHVAWAMETAASRGVSSQLDVEMLEGMADAEARALVASGQPVLLYAPVTKRDDFPSAVAYLVRRLDENSAPENYLRAALFLDDEAVLSHQRERFVTSVRTRHTPSLVRRRASLEHAASFANESDGDPTDRRYVDDVREALKAIQSDNDRHLNTLVESGDDEAVGIDPSASGRPWYHYRVADTSAIDRALERARAAVASWSKVPTSERAALLHRGGDEMASCRARSIAVMCRDGAKTVAEADPEVSEAVDFAHFYATRVNDDRSRALGVVLVVPPWNFPYAIPAGGVLAALAAGNVVVLKPAPESVAVAYELVAQLHRAGVAPDVLQLVPTRDDECGRHLVTHREVDAVVLTGAFETARLFATWRPDLRLLGETSGKNALVITASADVDLAVKDLVHSAFSHAGQKCSAASLAIVDEDLIRRTNFLTQLRDAVASLRVGAGYDLASQVGPIIAPPRDALRRALTTLDEGESWLVEPAALDEAEYRWRPGVKVGTRPGSWSHHHEWFGPVLAVMVAHDLDEATAWQNDTTYALTAGLHSLDVEECERWLERVEAGNLYVNRGLTGAVVRRQPFGGWKRSSVGPTAKAGGNHYVEALRDHDALNDAEDALAEARAWWSEVGSRAIDVSALRAEQNVARYRRASRPILVRLDNDPDPEVVHYLRGLLAITGAPHELSADGVVRGLLDVTLEEIDELVARAHSFSKVRWLASTPAPVDRLLDFGVSVDRRPLAQSGAVEVARWLLEQSVAVTNHRYGDVMAGPKPRCRGLGETT